MEAPFDPERPDRGLEPGGSGPDLLDGIADIGPTAPAPMSPAPQAIADGPVQGPVRRPAEADGGPADAAADPDAPAGPGTPDVTYRIEIDLDPLEYVDLLHRSGLAARRPVTDPQRIRRMLAHASLVVVARCRRTGRLVGLARALTDYAHCCYLSDLGVDRDWQGLGIGEALIRRTAAAAGRHARLLLLAPPAASAFYPRIGLQRFDNCWGLAASD